MSDGSTWSFAVTHSGRGGWIACVSEQGEMSLPIELVEGGDFAVHVRGAQLEEPGTRGRALRAQERANLVAQLRAWLDATDKSRWSVG